MVWSPDPISGTFEDGTTGKWVQNFWPDTTNVTIENSTEQAHGGTHSIKGTLHEVFPWILIRSLHPGDGPHFPPVGVPGTIIVSGWIYPTGNIAKAMIECFIRDDAGTVLEGVGTAQIPVVPNEWNLIQSPATLLSSTTGTWIDARLWALYNDFDTLVPGTVTYWDDLHWSPATRTPVRKRQLRSREFTIRRGQQNAQPPSRKVQHDI